MGVNNKKRRAAKQRRRERQRGAQTFGQTFDQPAPAPRRLAGLDGSPEWDAADASAVVDLHLTAAVSQLGRGKPDEAELVRWAEWLMRRVAPIPSYAVETMLADLLARLADKVVRGGWGPHDLGQLIGRQAGERHLDVLAAILHADAREHRRYAPGWLAALEALRSEARLRLDSTAALASGLRVAAVLTGTPLLDVDDLAGPGVAGVSAAAEHPKLAQVRALLAKAESTEYDEEAEALSAKAQELISRYALARLLEHDSGSRDGAEPQVRRVWLDPPYLRAKASLVSEVASANRCRSAVAERLGFSLLVGSAADLDAVELLVTSLLVQAGSAMLRHGRRFDETGVARTRSFRRSFLMAYAVGIGERLRAATKAVASEDSGRFLPVLRDQETRVSQAFDAMVPHTVGRSTSISNHEGWAAGLAAADLAQLGVNGQLREGAG